MPIPRLLKSTLLCASLALAFQLPAAAQIASGVRYDTSYPIISPVQAKQGIVVSEQRLASEVGQAILQRGGNAVDAAIAVGFALAVVLPNAGNIGGGGFMMIHDGKNGQDFALDFRELAPEKAHRDMFLDKDGKVIPRASWFSHLAVGVPGTVAGMEAAHQKLGSLAWSELLQPAIRLAEQGFAISAHLAELLQSSKTELSRWPATRAIFFKGERPLIAGEILRQDDLAKSLKAIAAQGSKAFYQGWIAEKIAAEMSKHQGLIRLEDLRNYRAVWRPVVKGDYRGYQIVAMPPPSSGGVHIIQMLNMLEHFPLAQQGANSAATLHQYSEVMKLAYADRSEYLGDPDFYRVPLKGITAKSYANQLVKQINLDKARPASDIKPGRPQVHESEQTTHYSTADRWGNAVATTYTLNLNFGSAIVAEGTGILLNNEMDDFAIKAGVPNAFGLTGGDANSVAPLKRPLSSMSPTIVLKDNKPILITGSPGGSRIITTTLQTIVNVLDFGMNAAEATISPRIHQQWQPDQLRYEKGISQDTLNLLQQKGQNLKLAPVLGKTQTIQIKANQFEGFSDPRNPDGAALGY